MTKLNYAELQTLYERYQSEGFEILAFPCNQFGVIGGQEPGTNAEIEDFARNKKGATFSLFSKIEVNGPNAHPLWKWMKQSWLDANNGKGDDDITWNFNKFLLDGEGKVIGRFGARQNPLSFETEVKAALEAKRQRRPARVSIRVDLLQDNHPKRQEAAAMGA